MKTFDIAVEYLKGVDFKTIDIYLVDKDPPVALWAQITNQHKLFQLDKRNTLSNDYYRSMCFEAAIRHLSDLANDRVSYFNVACEIIESEKGLVGTSFEKYMNTTYPKAMFEKFHKYCAGLNPMPPFLSEKSEVRDEFFMVAYAYLLEETD